MIFQLIIHLSFQPQTKSDHWINDKRGDHIVGTKSCLVWKGACHVTLLFQPSVITQK
jgi:hypothetical protein